MLPIERERRPGEEDEDFRSRIHREVGEAVRALSVREVGELAEDIREGREPIGSGVHFALLEQFAERFPAEAWRLAKDGAADALRSLERDQRRGETLAEGTWGEAGAEVRIPVQWDAARQKIREEDEVGRYLLACWGGRTLALRHLPVPMFEVVAPEEEKGILTTPVSHDYASPLAETRTEGRLFRATVGLIAQFRPLILNETRTEAHFPAWVAVTLAFTTTDGSPSWDVSSEAHAEIGEKVCDWLRSVAEDTSPDESAAVHVDAPSGAALAVVKTRTFPLAFGTARVDADSYELARSLTSLPVKKWDSLLSWTAEVEEKVKAILNDYGADKAIQSGRLKKRKGKNGGPDQYVLDPEEERSLRRSIGTTRTAFRYEDNATGKEYLARGFELRSGFAQIGLSWHGTADRLVADRRKALEREVAASVKRANRGGQMDLFEDLNDRERAAADRALRHLQALDMAQGLLKILLTQASVQKSSVAKIPALSLRATRGLAGDPRWKQRIEAGLEALRALEYFFETFETRKEKARGSFVSEWRYIGAGPGDHSEGTYFVSVSPGALGCLRAFASGRREIRGADELLEAVAYDFSKGPSEEDKRELGWGYEETKAPGKRKPVLVPRKTKESYLEVDAGSPFYADAAGLTRAQGALLDKLDSNLTKRSSGTWKFMGRGRSASKKSAPDAHDPRRYSRAECPILPEGREFVAALGNMKTPERGWRIEGTASRGSATGGGRPAGLAFDLGYDLKRRRAERSREKVVRAVLEDLRVVVEEYLGGVVALRLKTGGWRSLADARGMTAKDLQADALVYPFLPPDYREVRRRKWDETNRLRAERGEATTAWTATEDPEEAERSRDALARGESAAERPLHERLREKRLERGVSPAALAALFGVDRSLVSRWENGTNPDEDGRVRGKAIAAELRPFAERWIETGKAPTADELAARKTRRTGKKRTAGEPICDLANAPGGNL